MTSSLPDFPGNVIHVIATDNQDYNVIALSNGLSKQNKSYSVELWPVCSKLYNIALENFLGMQITLVTTGWKVWTETDSGLWHSSGSAQTFHPLCDMHPKKLFL